MKKAVVALVVVIIAVVMVFSFLILPSLNVAPTHGVVAYDPYEGGGTWFKGQVHCHSDRSDGELPPEEVVQRYADLGYDFVALTDHNIITRVTGSILVLGQEYGKGSTEATSGTHMNGINISYVPDVDGTEQERVDNITSQNGIAILNHPAFFPYAYDPLVLATLRNHTALEILNGKYLSMNTVEWWDDALTAGKRVWAVAADDAHRPDQFGMAWIMVRVDGDLTTATVIEAIKKGCFYASQGPVIEDVMVTGDTITISAPGADNVRFFGANGTLLKRLDGPEASYRFDGSEGYVRAVVGEDGQWAWAQPIFVDQRPGVDESSPEGSLIIFGPVLMTRSES
jgi:hypothetical protein